VQSVQPPRSHGGASTAVCVAMKKNEIERARVLRFRASCLSERILRHVAESEAKLRQVERYNRKPAPVQGRGAVVAVLQDEALDDEQDTLTASYLIAALGSTDSAGLALVAADWLAEAQPKLGHSPAVLDAALRVASTTTFGPEAALKYFHRRRSVGLEPTVHAANSVITACSHSGDSKLALEVGLNLNLLSVWADGDSQLILELV